MANILPGEPVPPGFEDEINRTPVILKTLETYKGSPIIGAEYIVEIHGDMQSSPEFHCVLCNKNTDIHNVISHLIANNHRLKYLERHYPMAMREINTVRHTPNAQSILPNIVKRVVEAIESHHGRLKPIVSTVEDYRRFKTKIISDVQRKHHHGEQRGPNFVKVAERAIIDLKSIQITIKAPEQINADLKKMDQTVREVQRIDLDEISSESDDGLNKSTLSDVGGKHKHKKHDDGDQLPAYRVIPRVNRSPPFNEMRSESHEKNPSPPPQDTGRDSRLPTPRELSRQASQIAQERYKWEKYHSLLEVQLKQLKSDQAKYVKNPEKHPDYSAEWKKFWNRRYKELQNEKKIDPNKYDYKPEWITYWSQRMLKLYDANVEKKKKELKEKLGLNENEDEENVDQLKEKYKIPDPLSSPTGAATQTGGTSSVNAGTGGARSHANNLLASAKRKRIAHNNSAANIDIIDISDEESLNNFNRRRRSSLSLSPSPTRSQTQSRARRQSRSRSPPNTRRTGCGDRSQQRYHSSATRSRSRSPYGSRRRPTSRDGHLRLRDDYRSERERERDYYGSTLYAHTGQMYRGRDSIEHYRVMDARDYPEYNKRENSLTPACGASKSISQGKESTVEPELDDGPLTVVGVLRMLSALEDNLGSLGPKALDMLGKALAMEKIKANAADDLLLNDDYCVFLETIKEKLKGLLITDVLEDPQKVRVVKKIITNIAAIIHQVNAKGNKTDGGDVDNDNTNQDAHGATFRQQRAIKIHHSFPFDRQMVSSRLAALLVSQGHEAVTTDDMDRLIHLFMLMAKLDKSKYEHDGHHLDIHDIYRALGVSRSKTGQQQNQHQQQRPTSMNAANVSIFDDDLDRAVTDLVKEVEADICGGSGINNGPGLIDKTLMKAGNSDANNLESLTDSDLQTLLQNFKFLSAEEQHHLIAHLKKLEHDDPIRVESLRKYVNVADLSKDPTACSDILSRAKGGGGGGGIGRGEPMGGGRDIKAKLRERVPVPPPPGIRNERLTPSNAGIQHKFSSDEEDDDYNFDDIFKSKHDLMDNSPISATDGRGSSSPMLSSTNKNMPQIVPVESSPNALTFKPPGTKMSINDTQSLIANLMGSLQQNNSNNNNSNTNNTNGGIQKGAQAATQQQQLQQQQLQQQQQQQRQRAQFIQQQQQQNSQQQQQAMQQPTHNMQGPNMPSYYGGGPPQQQQMGGFAPPPPQLGQQQHQGGGPPATVHYNPMFGYGGGSAGGGGGGYGYPPQQQQMPQQQHPGVWPAQYNMGGPQNYMPQQQQQQQQQHPAQQQMPPQAYNMYGGTPGNH